MIRIFFRHVWESLKSIRRNGWMTVAAVSSVAITLILVGIFLSLILNTTRLATNLENSVRVVAYLKANDTENEKTLVKDGKKTTNPDYQKVHKAIAQIPDVRSLQWSSKSDQLHQLENSFGKTWKQFQGDANPLLDAYIVRATTPHHVISVADNVKKIDGVSKTDYGGTNTKKIFGLSNVVRNWGFAGALLLILVAIFLISNTIRITIISRSREIQIMRLVGAKNSYIRWPFFLEGAEVGLLGAIIPSALVAFLYNIAYGGINPSLKTQELSMYSPSTFIPGMTLALFAIGIVIGALGSMLSMRRYLKA